MFFKTYVNAERSFIMKKIYTMFMADAFAATAFAQRGFTPPAELSDKYGFKVDGKTHL